MRWPAPISASFFFSWGRSSRLGFSSRPLYAATPRSNLLVRRWIRSVDDRPTWFPSGNDVARPIDLRLVSDHQLAGIIRLLADVLEELLSILAAQVERGR